ncbi:MAG: rod shape-determining protein [Clostridia bacterium]|nr:rod shape-determining protein [Clostridia bacterium]
MSKRISIDLGTKNTKIAEQNSGVILSEPSLVAINTKTGQLIATGSEVGNLLGKHQKI